MKYFLMFSSLGLIVFAAHISASRKSFAKKVAEELRVELSEIEKNFRDEKSLSAALVYQEGEKTSFYLDTFKIRIRPFVEFKLPGLASLRVRPRFAFIWGRKLPAGSKKYSGNFCQPSSQ